MVKLRVILADDHKPLLDAFEKLLVPEFEIVGRVSDGLALVSAAAALQPDVIVLDISMPLLNGFDAARQIRRTLPQIKLVFLTMDNDAIVAAEAFKIGASAYLHKLSAGSELAATIRKLA
jgi:DNA-binding NarL/FixJ family response regulator